MRFINRINMRHSHNWRNRAIGIMLERVAACTIQRMFKKRGIIVLVTRYNEWWCSRAREKGREEEEQVARNPMLLEEK